MRESESDVRSMDFQREWNKSFPIYMYVCVCVCVYIYMPIGAAARWIGASLAALRPRCIPNASSAPVGIVAAADAGELCST